MQVILAFPSLQVKMPANVIQVVDTFEKLVNFDFLPKEKIYDMTVAKWLKFATAAQTKMKSLD